MNVVFKIEVMMCPHCEARVKKIAESFDFVESAQVSFADGTAALVLCAEGDPEAVAAAITSDGYTVSKIIK